MIIFISESEISKGEFERQVSIGLKSILKSIEDEAKLKKKSMSDKIVKDKEIHDYSKGKGAGKKV